MMITGKMSMNLLHISIVFFLIWAPFHSFSQTPGKGVINENVPCWNFPGQSYSLYLPSAYDPSRSWPVLYCFDPGARGRVPVELFKEAAEELGMIVLGSNNSRNFAPFLPSCQALWVDSHARFRLNDRAVFTAGFSGGVHVAFSFGQALNIQVLGIIACSNGLPSWLSPDRVPRNTGVYLLAGVEDFNNQRTKNLVKSFSPLGIWSHADIFPGTHEWPPAAYAATALKALWLFAMKSGAIEKSETFIDRLYTDHLQAVQAAEVAGDDVQAYSIYQRMVKIFEGLKETSGISARLEVLKRSAKVLDYFAESEKTDRRESEIMARIQRAYLGLFNSDLIPMDISDGIRAMGIERLKSNSESKKSSPEKTASCRVINELYITAYVDGSQYFEKKEWQRAETAFDVTRRIEPDSWRPCINLAAVYAAQGEKKKALKMLKNAAGNGLDDPSLLERPWFDSLRQEKLFMELEQQVKLKAGEKNR